MAAVPDLSGILIFEKDTDNELMCAWVYPSIEKPFKTLLAEKCNILSKDHQSSTFCFGRWQKLWYFIKSQNIEDTGLKNKVTDIYVIIIAQNFNPEFYEALGKTFAKSYLNSSSGVLSQYLSMYTKGYCLKDDSTKLQHSDFDMKKAYLRSCIKELIQLFGMESILIYNGLVLKKRIAVYSPKLDTLLHICRSLPTFVFHRLNWNIVHPFVHINEDELSEVKKDRTYVAGFTDATIENQLDMYDLFLNVPDGEIIINPQSKEYFQMGKMHKDIAKYLVQAADDEDVTDEDIIREITRRSKEIISNLKSLDKTNPDAPEISLEMLQERNLTSAMQSFLYNLASAEGIVKL